MNGNLSALLVLLAAAAFAQPPAFDAPVAIEANGTPINVGAGGNALPFVIDWNGDGNLDMITFDYYGSVFLRRNITSTSVEEAMNEER